MIALRVVSARVRLRAVPASPKFVYVKSLRIITLIYVSPLILNGFLFFVLGTKLKLITFHALSKKKQTFKLIFDRKIGRQSDNALKRLNTSDLRSLK